MKRVVNYTLNHNKGIVVRLDDTAVEKVMVWALGDGEETDVRETIAYWCDTITAAGGKNAAYHKDGKEFFDIYTHLQRGGELLFHDVVSDTEFTLTRDALINGIKQALYEYYYHLFHEDLGKLLDLGLLRYADGVYELHLPQENWNMFGDYAVQFAIFNDVYYTHHSVRVIGNIRIHIPRFKR
ncbi:MAG: hypothetical protein E7Z72_03900 [Methanocorpusculum parvum]|nr:hypothetical protein [Methanocorpusculum parvum]